MNDIATRHAAHAANFTRIVNGVTDWDAPTPVAEWKARDVVEHLVSWPPAMLSGYGFELAAVEVGEDPAVAWAEHNASMETILADEARLDTVVTTHAGEQTVAWVLDSFYLPDVFMHAWDLAKASGQDPRLDPAVTESMALGMAESVEMLASSGQFGIPVVLDESHPMEDRLIAVIGRDPHWSA